MTASASPTSTSAGVRRRLAPGATTITFSPVASTRISATPDSPSSRATPVVSTPSRSSERSTRSSLPIRPTNRTVAPSRAAATAWLAPLPPGKRSNTASVTVSPGRGNRSQRATWSTFAEPTTVIRGGTSGTLTTVNETSQAPYGGGGDAGAARDGLSRRFRRHAAALVRSGRSPLYVRLMGSAADDIDGGGVVARLFAGIATPPGSVPQLRLVGALHYLVLAGHAPALAAFYPSAGGVRPVEGVWPVAEAVMEEQFDLVRARLHRTVQTNEPGRSAG